MRWLVLAMLLIPGAGIAAPISTDVTLVGVRTGVTYVPLPDASQAGPPCESCELAVPRNEWLWLEFKGLAAGKFVDLSIEYLSPEGIARSIEASAVTPIPRLVIPAPRSAETAIHVEVTTLANFPDVSERVLATFAVAGDLPRDPREIQIRESGGWARHAITSVGEDTRAMFFFASSSEPSGDPQGWIFDHHVINAGGSHGGAGYGLGERNPGSDVVRIQATPAAELTFRPPVDGFGSSVVTGFSGYYPTHVAELAYGFTGSPGAPHEVLFFSLNDSFNIVEFERGDLWTIGSKPEGLRTHAHVASAQAGATVEARAALEDVSFVIARAEGGSIGGGSAEVRHGGRSISAPIANLGRPLEQLSHGDCSGEWSARLTGTTATGPRAPLDAGILAARGYTPSPTFQWLWDTDDGWC